MHLLAPGVVTEAPPCPPALVAGYMFKGLS